MDISGKVIVLTGASEGIGLATAKALDGLGAKLVLAARSADKLEAAARDLSDAIAVPTDMRDPDAIKGLIQAAQDRYGRVDALVNNAGQGMIGPLETIDIDDYQAIIELNVYGPLRAMQAVIPLMREQGGGTIVNVSSNVSKNYFPSLSAYASTKYALNCLSLTARTELEPDHIVVSVVHPGLTATGFSENSRVHATGDWRGGRQMPQADPPEAVAEKIVQAIETGAAEIAMR
jgi:short-subunit dehydrogenase